MLLASLAGSATGQLGRISGELRYEHRYSDYLYGRSLTTLRIMNPVLDLRMAGKIGTARIATYNLFTSLNAIYVSTGSGYYSYSSAQYSWNKYNFNLSLLPYMPVKLTLGARENSNTVDPEGGDNRTETRQQEQRVDLSVHQIPWLPTLSSAFVRTRSFSVRGYPYDIVTQTLTASATNSSDSTGVYSLSTTLVDFRDRLSRAYDKFMVVEFSGQRSLTETQSLDVNAEYDQYTGFSSLGGGALYSLIVSDRTRTMTRLSGTVEQSTYYQSRSISLGQSVLFRPIDHFVFGVGVSGYLADGLAATWRNRYGNFGGYGSAQHQRLIGRTSITNALSAGYNEQQYAKRFTNIYATFSNSVSRPVGVFSVSGTYDLSYLRVRHGIEYDVVENSAGVTLSGVLPHAINSQSSLRYRDSRYPGDPTPNRGQRSIFANHRFNASFRSIIPINAGFSMSASWYMASIKGRTYAWALNFASPSFFVRGLVAEYSYSRSFDPYLNGEVVEHRGSFSYQWRAMMLATRYRYASYPLRVREVTFSIARRF